LNGWVSANNNAAPATIQITAIPFAAYDLYIYLNHDRASEDVLITENSSAFSDFLAQKNDLSITEPITFVRQSEIMATSATLKGNLIDNGDGGGSPTLTFYYGLTDADRNASTWDSQISGGSRTSPGIFSATLTALQPGMTYYFRATTTHGAGTRWASASSPFQTRPLILPALAISPATSVKGTCATLNGQVPESGGAPPTVTLFFGTTDGGQTPDHWDFSASMGRPDSDFARLVSELFATTTYYFSAHALNAAGEA